MNALNKILVCLEEIQASETNHIDVSKTSSIADHIVITSGKNQRHNRAIMHAVITLANQLGEKNIRTEGADYCQWILIVFGDIIVHIMLPETRTYYALDKLWHGEPSSE